jgi:hypothetical protein
VAGQVFMQARKCFHDSGLNLVPLSRTAARKSSENE